MRLPNSRYEQIKGTVVDLFSRYGVDRIPVDPWKLSRDMGVKLVPFSSLSEEQLAAALRLSEGGLKFKLVNEHGRMGQIALYDDDAPLGRQRFTILHELGHIVLGHKQESELAEAEADFFAKYAIAPPMLIDLLKPLDYMDVAEAFGLSKECAFNSMRYYMKWLRVRGFKPYEYSLVSLFTSKDENGKLNLREERSA